MLFKLKKYFISEEFDKKLYEAFDIYYKKQMAELDEKVKKANITFTPEFEEKMQELILKYNKEKEEQKKR